LKVVVVTASGQSENCSVTRLVRDTNGPLIVCPPDLTLGCNPAKIPTCDEIKAMAIITNVPDNCPEPLRLDCTSEDTVDKCGNESFCTQNVTVVDTTPPNITCADDLIVECGGTWSFLPPEAVDICDATNITVELISTTTNSQVGQCPKLWTAVQTWRAVDRSGNESFCSQTVTVVDTTPPNITCADDLIVECGNAWAFTAPEAVDVCDGDHVTVAVVSTTTNSVKVYPVLSKAARTWRATDQCGNESFCTQNVTVVDTTPPNITCPDNLVIECGMPWAFGVPRAVDVCYGTNVTITVVNTETNRLCGSTFTAVRTWRATDPNGNYVECSQWVIVVDTMAPTLICRDRVVECGSPWFFTPPSVYDVCDKTNVTLMVVSTETNKTCGSTYNVVRTWRATDACGNVSECSQVVLVVDTTPPVLTCRPDKIVECGLPWTFSPPSATDMCDSNVTVVVINTTTNVNPCGLTAVRTWQATDDCGNVSECSQTVLLVDTVPPSLICGSDRVVECGTAWSFAVPTVSDLCDGANVSLVVVSTVTNGTPCDLIVTRTWRATDKCGNWTTCSQTVRTVDVTPPVLVCAREKLVECGAAWNFDRPTARDICSGTNVDVVVVSRVTNVADCVQTIVQTWRASDPCGNSAECSQVITVVDTTAPSLACFPDKTVECVQAWDFDEPIASDICTPNVTVTIVSTVTNTGPENTLVITRCWQAADLCGNLTVCCQTVTILACPEGGSCRVTGGSNHQLNTYQAPCITTPPPTFVSHGGQVGAPFSVASDFAPNSPCISGEWQHNRHLQGNSLVGSFHASGNGHESQFDSLLCACLPCDEKPNSIGVVGGICNQGDKICGPQPRRAPANKITFSGVGDYTFTTGRKMVKAVFRVDIEDRSEGNSQSSALPPDRYRIRLWLLDPSCGRNPDPNSAEAMVLRFVASADPTKIADLATTEELKDASFPPDIDDGGDMTQGNHQIHPSTGARCGAMVPAPAPAIEVVNEVAYVTPSGARKYAKIAYGHQGEQNPVFAHQVTIINSGIVTLTNLSVAETTDTILEDVTASFFAPGATLAPGESVTMEYTTAWSQDTIQSLVVSGSSILDGMPLVAASAAMASVSAGELQPWLTIQRVDGKITLTWPLETPPDFILEVSDLKPPVTWSAIPNVTRPYVVPDSASKGTRFCRLRVP
jgi:hypothetical protein